MIRPATPRMVFMPADVVHFQNPYLKTILKILKLIGFVGSPQIKSPSSSGDSNETRSSLCTRSNILILLINAICLYCAVSFLYNTLNADNSGIIDNLRYISTSISFASATFSINILFFKRQKLAKLDQTMYETLTQRSSKLDHSKPTKIPTILIISFLCAFIVSFGANFSRFAFAEKHIQLDLYRDFLGFATVNITSWILKNTVNTVFLIAIYFVVFFAYSMYVLYLIFCQTILEYLDHFNQELFTSHNLLETKSIALKIIIRDYNAVLAVFERFEDCFSTFNFCWMVSHVQHCVFKLTCTLSMKNTQVRLFTDIAESWNILLVFFLLLVFTIRVNEKVKTPLTQMRKLFSKDPTSASEAVLITQMILLHQMKDFAITAGGFFQINRSFVMSMFMGFLSYGVLIYQLSI